MKFLQEYWSQKVDEKGWDIDLYVLPTNSKTNNYEKSLAKSQTYFFPWAFDQNNKDLIEEGAGISSIQQNQANLNGVPLHGKISIGIFIKDCEIYSVALFLEKVTGPQKLLEDFADNIWNDRAFKYIYMLSDPITLDRPLPISTLVKVDGKNYNSGTTQVPAFKMSDLQKDIFLNQADIDELEEALGALAYTKEYI